MELELNVFPWLTHQPADTEYYLHKVITFGMETASFVMIQC